MTGAVPGELLLAAGYGVFLLLLGVLGIAAAISAFLIRGDKKAYQKLYK